MGDKLIWIFIFIIGLCIGSFLNVLAYRIPQKMKPNGRSMCPHCNHELKWYELIPVFSYILLKGKCKNCNERISILYPIIEIMTALFYSLLYLTFGFGYEFFLYVFVITIMIIIIRIDYEHKYIPDRLNLSLLIAGVVHIVYLSINKIESIFPNIIGFVVGFLLCYIIRLIGSLVYKKEAMGFGDVKLLAVIGLLLGYKGAIFTFFIGCIIATLIELTLMKLKVKSRDDEIAFGPYLIYASVLFIFIGNSLVDLYLSLIGG